MANRPDRQIKERKLHSALLFSVLVLVALFWIWHCPFLWLTGIPCPGCHMTRALMALGQGNLALSFHEHALLIPTAILLFAALLLQLFHKRKEAKYVLILWITLMFAYWIWRMITIFPQAPMTFKQDALIPMMLAKLGFL